MLGPLWTDVLGVELDATDRELLMHPMVGGVVLFARNFRSVEQLSDLTYQIRALREPSLPIAVDHEGGRVQRFHEGFTRLPPMADVGALPTATAQRQAARAVGTIIAYELRQCGIDMSFVPVLDLAVAGNLAIGTRAFAADPMKVTGLAMALAEGLRGGGYPAVAKHFPGHGSIVADSHAELPVDERTLPDVLSRDGVPFRDWAQRRAGGIMTAHIRFPNVDGRPVTFSSHWLKTVLRNQLQFDGVIFSDDLGMQAARQMGSVAQTVVLACDAGCDVVLVCNDREAAAGAADALRERAEKDPERADRERRLHEFWAASRFDEVLQRAEYEAARTALISQGLVVGA